MLILDKKNQNPINTLTICIHGEQRMATLNSPGISVTVDDRSFYVSNAPGTVPLIIVASAENKTNGAGTGTAVGTQSANAGKVYLLTSQKDLSDTFGTPYFQTDAQNNPIHASEVSEYGLQAAYSLLGVSNRAYVARADINLDELKETANIPAGEAENETVWFDTAETNLGVFEWQGGTALSGGQKFVVKDVAVITDPLLVTDFGAEDYTPASSFGAVGTYALVSVTGLNTLYYKKPETGSLSLPAGTWVEVGTPDWVESWPTAIGTTPTGDVTLSGTDTLSINSQAVTLTGITTLSALVAEINDTTAVTNLGIRAAVINGFINIYSTGNNVALTGTAVAKVGLLSQTYLAPKLQIQPHTQIPQYKISDTAPTYPSGYPTGSMWVKSTSPNFGANWIIKRYSTATKSWSTLVSNLYPNNSTALAKLDPVGGGLNLRKGTLYVKYNSDEGNDQLANFVIYNRTSTGPTTITSVAIVDGTFTAGPNTFTISESDAGLEAMSTPVSVTFSASAGAGTATGNANEFLAALTAALPTSSNIIASLNTTTNVITISHKQGGEIKFVDSTNDPISKLFSPVTTTNFYNDPTGGADKYVASLWSSSNGTESIAIASDDAPTTTPADQTLWYNSDVSEVDIMINDGSKWVGYASATSPYYNANANLKTDPAGPIVSATRPTTQSDGTLLQTGDLWIDTSDLENFPMLYKYNDLIKTWVLVDKTDNTTEEGIVFDDARWNTTGEGADPASIEDLLTSDFVDFDCPDPALYPRGTLLYNLRRSGNNVKRYVKNYVNVLDRNSRVNNELMTNYYPDRWVSDASNQDDGSGSFGRKAQRQVVVQSLRSLIVSNQNIRDEESLTINLLAAPGYPELIPDLVSLNYDRGLDSFVIGDTPARLTPDATTLNNWGNNTSGALVDSDKGLVTTDPYLGVYYPWGFTSDNNGRNIAVPPSHMMLRTIALSDNVSYPWFAPAGTVRGRITNASSVGYVNSEGEFQSVALNTGQRDTLASIHVNPITFISGTGLVAYGQYTRQLVASALDRVNVARLVVYLRRMFSQLARPYVFEPNDTITRNEIKQAADSLLLELVGQRALYDYITVCDSVNNTPAVIDRSELHLDIAIEPVKAAEFIYIPIRLENTGAIAQLGAAAATNG